MALNLRALHNISQHVSLLVRSTDTTAHSTTVTQCIAYAETDHSITACAALGQLGQELGHNHKCVTVIEIITVQHSKRLLDDILTHHYSMIGTPGLLTTLGNSKSLWQGIQGLEAQLARNMTLVS